MTAARSLVPDVVKRCSCSRAYTAAEWAKLPVVGYMPDWLGGMLRLANCACGSTMALEEPELDDTPELAALLREVDAFGGKVTFIALSRGGWKAVVSGLELPPHFGHGVTGPAALEEVLRFARAIGAIKR